jgi:hypothetical protein
MFSCTRSLQNFFLQRKENKLERLPRAKKIKSVLMGRANSSGAQLKADASMLHP